LVGVIPSGILPRRFARAYINAAVAETENDILSSESNINAVQFIGTAGGGVSYSFDAVGFFAQFEYRRHFTNTYTGLFLSHKQSLLGGTIGLTYSF